MCNQCGGKIGVNKPASYLETETQGDRDGSKVIMATHANCKSCGPTIWAGRGSDEEGDRQDTTHKGRMTRMDALIDTDMWH